MTRAKLEAVHPVLASRDVAASVAFNDPDRSGLTFYRNVERS